jgi:hypothetical protein
MSAFDDEYPRSFKGPNCSLESRSASGLSIAYSPSIDGSIAGQGVKGRLPLRQKISIAASQVLGLRIQCTTCAWPQA